MLRRHSFAPGEVYHIFNRGAHKQKIFTSQRDYERFLLLLYCANQKQSIHLGNLMSPYKGRSSLEIVGELENMADSERLVSVLAYALMPNHFHLVLKEKSENGITTFMRKLGTAYSMYFNTKYEHSGVLFQGRFGSRHVTNDSYFRYIFAYVHLNPIELVCPDWEERGISNTQDVRDFMHTYAYSSYPDYSSRIRTQAELLSLDEAPAFLKTQNDLEDLLRWNSEFESPAPPTRAVLDKLGIIHEV